MTAMVDLAFLLITFFMLTTTMSKPQTMEITMPDKTNNPEDVMKVRESRSVVVLLGEDDQVYYYQGVVDEEPEIGVTHFGQTGIRQTLIEKKQQIGKVLNTETGELEDGIIVIIKATDEATYKNMVDILDEMTITGIRTYAIVDITQGDLDLIAELEGMTPGQEDVAAAG
jgi:biopolymer transport protein ExbD